MGLGPRLPRQAHAEAQTRLLPRRRAGEKLRTVDGIAPNDLKPQRWQSQRDCHNVRMIDVSDPIRTLHTHLNAAERCGAASRKPTLGFGIAAIGTYTRILSV